MRVRKRVTLSLSVCLLKLDTTNVIIGLFPGVILARDYNPGAYGHNLPPPRRGYSVSAEPSTDPNFTKRTHNSSLLQLLINLCTLRRDRNYSVAFLSAHRIKPFVQGEVLHV